MTRRLPPLARLQGDQLLASDPCGHAGLSASAGTGKTHVLAARVLRLLLSGVDPASILCLTFTKAGAAEMAERIHGRLAQWVRLKDSDLAGELAALDEDPGSEMRKRARTLFARVIEAPGGGLRILTVHAFAQGLLAAFPTEAGLTPGFRPLDEREEQQLARATLADLLVRAEAGGDFALVRDIQKLSLRLGEGGAEAYLTACARAPEAMAMIGPREGIEARLRHHFELPLGDVEEVIARECGNAAFDIELLGELAEANRRWGTATGLSACAAIESWVARSDGDRAATLMDLAAIVLTRAGEQRRPPAGLIRVASRYQALAGRLIERCRGLLAMRATAGLVADLAAGLRAGQAFAAAYGDAKRARGVADFDDLIRWAEQLLLTPGMGDWVRYKLDQRTDHILVDEAQDTNERQWNIVRALALEFFAGEGAAGERLRTIFTVGDFKQAIFGFQGTDPQSFERARAWFAREARTLRESAIEAGVPPRKLPPEFIELSIDRSYRSAPPILAVVDRVIEGLGAEALGLTRPPNPHQSHHERRPGSVVLWLPTTDAREESVEEAEEGWISESVLKHADLVAKQVAAWLAQPFWLECRRRPLRPEDILLLVRRRGELAPLLVARLQGHGVPVAGMDRLRLSAPLAVKDLLAAARFAMQPLDDLNLASLLVSPLFGWSQDLLHEVAHDRSHRLWPRVREHEATPAETLERLHALLAATDFTTPYVFFETLLSGPLDGRRKLIERLGNEARDPIEELLSAALEYERAGTLSLQGFLDWFARGEVEVVRDPSGPQESVRVMTAHGAKGLQAPIVILADACADPDRSRGGPGGAFASLPVADRVSLPIFRPRKDETVEPLTSHVAAQDRREREEHWRLLYVALTRAEERLYVGGSLGARNRTGPPAGSWYRAVENALLGLGCAWAPSDRWDREIRYGSPEHFLSKRQVRSPQRRSVVEGAAALRLPEWLRCPAAPEARPPRPLVPSAIGEDDIPYPPPEPAQREAARRGKLLHQLFERLPQVAAPQRRALADRWLEHSAGLADPAVRESLIIDACRVIEDPLFADLFGPQALAEAPLAAVIEDGIVVSGTVDRLLVDSDRILVADFKTGRNVPARPEAIPVPHLRQMAAYRSALRVIFPGRRVEAALVYTAAPVLYAVPDALLDAYQSEHA